MTSPNGGYKNPAYDNSLFDYEYVPEIDPDSPILTSEKENHGTMVYKIPWFGNTNQTTSIQDNPLYQSSEDFDDSDNSNKSIIIEEWNNRRVMLICEKREKSDDENVDSSDKFLSGHGAYFQNVSLESEGECDSPVSHRRNKVAYSQKKRMSSPVGKNDEMPLNELQLKSAFYSPAKKGNSENYQKIDKNKPKPQGKHHRYEVISDEEDVPMNQQGNREHEETRNVPERSVHRFAEISIDENGFPKMENEIEVIQKQNPRLCINRSEPNSRSCSPSNKISSPSRCTGHRYYRPVSPCLVDTHQVMQGSPVRSSYPHRPVAETRSLAHKLEKRDLSPPHSASPNTKMSHICANPLVTRKYASSLEMSQEKYDSQQMSNDTKEKKNVFSAIASKLSNNKSNGNSEKRHREKSAKTCTMTHTKHRNRHTPEDIDLLNHLTESEIKFVRSVARKAYNREKMETVDENSELKVPVRRNISTSFIEDKKPIKPFTESPNRMHQRAHRTGNPYKPTTEKISSPANKTAVLTSSLQKKFKKEQFEKADLKKSERQDTTDENFRHISKMFQSTGHLAEREMETYYWEKEQARLDDERSCRREPAQPKLKRNKSVPDFSRRYNQERQIFSSMEIDEPPHSVNYKQKKHFPGEDMSSYQYFPPSIVDSFSPIRRSQLSLMNRLRYSSSSLGRLPRSPMCLTFISVTQTISGIITFLIALYFITKIGRRYYLDFGFVAGFVNVILGLLGYPAQYWNWFPNRNYISGYLTIGILSIFNSAVFGALLIYKPMTDESVLGFLSGAICGISAISLGLTFIGIIMSGCYKTPPSENAEEDL